MLEAALKKLFDYQRFEKNVPLQDEIDGVLERYAQNRSQILADDDLALAAGGAGIIEEEKQEPDHDGRGTI